MKKKFLFLMTLLAVSLLALAEMSIFVYQKDGAKIEYLAANVDSIGFVNFHTIVFDANGGDGSMDALRVKESESVNLPANIYTKSAFAFTGWNTAADGTGTAYADKASVTLVANQTLYAQWAEYEWVDLGLPSGTKWATMNVGASSPEDYGDYFAWGETTTKSSYESSTYSYSSNPTTLPLDRDAAYTNWGPSWCMPTNAELKELRDNCTWTWTTQNGVSGYKVTSKVNGNSIFLPATGYRSYSSLRYAGSNGYYWTSSLYTDSSSSAYGLDFSSGYVNVGSDSRYFGRSVRAVLRKTYTITFDANGGEGSMEVISLLEGNSVTLSANTFTNGLSTFTGWNTAADGSGTAYADQASITPNANLTLYAQWEETTTGTENGHEWVDLGLPSGTKWATMNVGADSPEDYGDYFAWGETTTKSKYTYSNYYYSSNPTTLPLNRDAAYTNWGTSWRMPTNAELKELKDNCTWTRTIQNGVGGYNVTSKINGNSIFLPAAGYRDGFGLNEDAGNRGYYWSSSLHTNDSGNAYYLRFHSDIVYSGYYASRDHGYSVRPVLAK